MTDSLKWLRREYWPSLKYQVESKLKELLGLIYKPDNLITVEQVDVLPLDSSNVEFASSIVFLDKHEQHQLWTTKIRSDLVRLEVSGPGIINTIMDQMACKILDGVLEAREEPRFSVQHNDIMQARDKFVKDNPFIPGGYMGRAFEDFMNGKPAYDSRNPLERPALLPGCTEKLEQTKKDRLRQVFATRERKTKW